MKNKLWFIFILITVVTWGIWGAFSEIPEKNGFPATFTYIVWALSMLPCAVIALIINKGKLDVDRKSVLLGSVVGLLGAGGQLILFKALTLGPAYIVFPFIAMSPVVVITLSVIFLKERASGWQKTGIVVALLAIFFLSYQKSDGSVVSGYLWIVLSTMVFFMWGFQGFTMKFANKTMSAESIFVYMAISALLMIPFAYYMTDFSVEGINLSWSNATTAFFIQILNSIGALTLVYAYRHGNAILVAPMEGLSPMVTVVISLALYAVIPTPTLLVGFVLAALAMYALSK